MNNCRWIIQPFTDTQEAIYCEKPVKFIMRWNGGEVASSKVRYYQPFCPKHTAEAEAEAEAVE